MNDALVRHHHIHISLAQRRNRLPDGGEAEHLRQLRHDRRFALHQRVFRRGRGLNRRAPAVQLAQLGIIAVRAHHRDLPAVQIRPRPCVYILAPVHRKAAPQAVHLAGGQRFILVFPRNFAKFHVVPQPPERLVGKLHVDPDKIARAVLIGIRRVNVAADDDNVSLRRPRGRGEQQQRQQQPRQAVCFHHVIVSLRLFSRVRGL